MLLVRTHHWQFGAKPPRIQGVKSQKALFYVTSIHIEQIAAFWLRKLQNGQLQAVFWGREK
jgi:hypothetical protein